LAYVKRFLWNTDHPVQPRSQGPFRIYQSANAAARTLICKASTCVFQPGCSPPSQRQLPYLLNEDTLNLLLLNRN
jgi:hypothetical protein